MTQVPGPQNLDYSCNNITEEVHYYDASTYPKTQRNLATALNHLFWAAYIHYLIFKIFSVVTIHFFLQYKIIIVHKHASYWECFYFLWYEKAPETWLH